MGRPGWPTRGTSSWRWSSSYALVPCSRNYLQVGFWEVPDVSSGYSTRCARPDQCAEPLGLAIHSGAQKTHQDVKDKVSRGGSESHSIEARLRKKRPPGYSTSSPRL